MKSVAPPAFGSDTLGEFDPVDYFHLGPDDPEQMPIGTAWPENTYACLEHGAFEGPPLGDLDGYGIYEQAPHGSTPTPTMSWQQPTPEIDPKIYESLGIEPPAPLDHFDQQAAHGSAQTPAMPLLHAAWPAEKTPEIDSAINASLDPPDAMDIFVGLDRGQHGTADTPTMPRQPHPALPAAPDVFFGAAFQQPLAGAPEDPGQSLPETALHSEAATSKRNRARKHRERASRIEYAELNGVTPNVAAAAILNSERSQINPAHANSQGRPNAAGVAFIQASYANNGNISEVVRASGFSRDQVRYALKAGKEPNPEWIKVDSGGRKTLTEAGVAELSKRKSLGYGASKVATDMGLTKSVVQKKFTQLNAQDKAQSAESTEL